MGCAHRPGRASVELQGLEFRSVAPVCARRSRMDPVHDIVHERIERCLDATLARSVIDEFGPLRDRGPTVGLDAGGCHKGPADLPLQLARAGAAPRIAEQVEYRGQHKMQRLRKADFGAVGVDRHRFPPESPDTCGLDRQCVIAGQADFRTHREAGMNDYGSSVHSASALDGQAIVIAAWVYTLEATGTVSGFPSSGSVPMPVVFCQSAWLR